MSVNIFGGGRNTAANAGHSTVATVGGDRNFNQRLIILSNKLAQKVNKSGDTMNGDLKFTFNSDSSNLSLSLGVDGMDRNHSMTLLLGNVHNQIYRKNGDPVSLIAQYGFQFKCSEGKTTTFDHVIQFDNNHITGLTDPELPSGAVTKQYSDGKLALAVNELLKKIYLNTASLSLLQTDVISRIEAHSIAVTVAATDAASAAASVNLNQDQKIQEVLGKAELNESGIENLRRETTELLSTTKTEIESNHEQRMATIRGRQQEIIDSITSTQRTLNNLRTRHNDLNDLVDADRIVLNNIVTRVDRTRFVKNNVCLIPRLNSTVNKDFIVTASHNANEAWELFTSNTSYYWNSGVNVDEEGTFLEPI